MSLKKSTRSPKQDQATRFIEAAKQLDADQSGKSFERAIERMVKAAKPTKTKTPR